MSLEQILNIWLPILLGFRLINDPLLIVTSRRWCKILGKSDQTSDNWQIKAIFLLSLKLSYPFRPWQYKLNHNLILSCFFLHGQRYEYWCQHSDSFPLFYTFQVDWLAATNTKLLEGQIIKLGVVCNGPVNRWLLFKYVGNIKCKFESKALLIKTLIVQQTVLLLSVVTVLIKGVLSWEIQRINFLWAPVGVLSERYSSFIWPLKTAP